jgi:glycerophosphoryl diester phosphodiesterase
LNPFKILLEPADFQTAGTGCPADMRMLQRPIKTLLGLCLLGLILYQILCWIAEPVPEHPYFLPDKFFVIAHRGGRSLGPEGTLLTFRRAVELGIDVLEMDVRSTRDGQLVVLHDHRLERTTDGVGAVENFTLSELKKLDAAHRWSPDESQSFPLRGKGITIPTLAEVFAAFPETRMNLEIKDSGANAIQPLCRLIRNHRMSDRVMVACFDAGKLNQFRSACPEVATSAGASEATWFYGLQKLYLESLHSPNAQALQVPEKYGRLTIVDQRFIAAAHSRNLRVHVWTVNGVDSMKRLLKLGVDGVITDYPQVMLHQLGKQKGAKRGPGLIRR